MNEEVDYAQMLEIPVSTVNVVRKRSKKRNDAKEKVIDKVNEKISAEENSYGEKFSEASSVPIYDSLKKKKPHPVLIAEFAVACALCLTIFLTNVFMENSALNTFVDSVFSSEKKIEADERNYSEFTLSGIVNDFSEVSVSATDKGVLYFTGKAGVYPVCDGTVEAVTETDGLYTVSLSHSTSFESVVSGLSSVYVKKGDAVKGNLPIGYSDGENKVEVMLYDNDSLLNCCVVSADNSISWKS